MHAIKSVLFQATCAMTCLGTGKEDGKGQAKMKAAVPAADGGLQGTKHRLQSSGRSGTQVGYDLCFV